MTFKKTTLWKSAFENSRSDSTAEEQSYFAERYEAMRSRAAVLVTKIAADLPNMTVHDVTHLDALWDMASIAAGENVDLNPAEALVFGGAVLFHDSAMTLAAYPDGIEELRAETEWLDFYKRYSEDVGSNGSEGVKEAEKRATSDALRALHAKQAERLPMISWEGPQKQAMFIIEDQKIRNFYGPKIGLIAYSHWWSIARVEENLAGKLGPLAGITNCTVDLLKVACLLRVADAMHVDQRRAPTFDFALTQPRGVSEHHWKFQERMAEPYVQGDALIYTAQPPFTVCDADAWWTAFDALQVLDRELSDVDRVLRDRRNAALVVRRVEGAHSPSDLARTVETSGWTPVDSTIRVSDVPKIVATLGGSKLYGTDMSAGASIRELIQNGLDAITARRRLQSRPNKWGELQVILQKRDDGFWLCFEDNGVGMSQSVLTGPLIDFGNSFWKSSFVIQEFPGLASTGMKSRGKYGIGFFSIFMLGDQVRVITRRFDRAPQSTQMLEFRDGLASRPNLRDANANDAPIDGGTRIEVRLKCDPTEPNGVLYENRFNGYKLIKLKDLIAAIAPACDVDITVLEENVEVGSTRAGDWLGIDTAMLLNRITKDEQTDEKLNESTSAAKPWLDLVELRAEDGRVFGRARIDVGDRFNPRGLITVDGLGASKIGLIAGILVGVETTAARNEAEPIVPTSVLAAWASEQAIRLSAAPIPDSAKARAAIVVLALGGNAADLPIVRWKNEWKSARDFATVLQGIDSFMLHEGLVSHDDGDDVTVHDFDDEFDPSTDLAESATQLFSFLRSADWITPVIKNAGTTPIKLIEQQVINAWGSLDWQNEIATVGETSNTEILRSVNIYTR